MFEILDKACTPTKGTKFSACVDLFAREDVVIGAGETVLVPLGIKIDLDKPTIRGIHCAGFMANAAIGTPLEDIKRAFMKQHQLNLHIRSSMSAKHGLIIANGTGIIDLDYPGEIMICLHYPVKQGVGTQLAETYNKAANLVIWNGLEVNIKKGQPIAQISLVEHKTYLLGVESEDKRTGGFGSTSK